MDIEPHVVRVAQQLQAAAALGDERTHEVATALAAAAAPAVRLAVLEAVAAAVADLNALLVDAPGAPSVGVRLDGDHAVLDVHLTSDAGATREQPAAADGDTGDAGTDDATARVSLRLSTSLKARVDAAAGVDGVSVNTWLVRAATTALNTRAGAAAPRRHADARRITGWIN